MQNDFNEDWSRWEPEVPNLANNYYIASACYSYDGFKVLLEEEGGDQRVEVLFPYGISSIRITEEGMDLKLGDNLSEKYGPDFYRNWCFFKIEQSSYLQWLSDQSYEISDFCKVKHFVLRGVNCMLDIATLHDQPEVKILATGHSGE